MAEPHDPNPNHDIINLTVPITRSQWSQWEHLAKARGVTLEQYIRSCVEAHGREGVG